MAPPSPERTRKARPQSTIALEFSSALDEMFKLNGLGALELSVEEKKDDLNHQKYKLDDLEARLRETTERLARMEAHHKRTQSSMPMKFNSQTVVEENENDTRTETDDSGGSGSSTDGSENGERRSRVL